MSQPGQFPITVLMSVFNGERWLEEAITSVLNQSFSDFEFIIVNDGSTDRSLDIIKRYALQDCRIRLLDKPNTGLPDSLNKGAKLARGMYIARMDGDDVCNPNRFERQVSFLERNLQAALVSGAVEYINENGVPFGRTYPITSANKIRNRLLTKGNCIAHPAVMMRRSVFSECGGYCNQLVTMQDYHLWVKMLRRGYELRNLPSVLISYRTSGSAISNWNQSERQIALMNEILQFDNPPDQILSEFQQLVASNKNKLISQDCRKANLMNTYHCKISRLGKRFGIENIIESPVCLLNNMLS